MVLLGMNRLVGLVVFCLTVQLGECEPKPTLEKFPAGYEHICRDFQIDIKRPGWKQETYVAGDEQKLIEFQREHDHVSFYVSGNFRGVHNGRIYDLPKQVRAYQKSKVELTIQTEADAYTKAEALLRKHGLWDEELRPDRCSLAPVPKVGPIEFADGLANVDFIVWRNGIPAQVQLTRVELNRITGEPLSILVHERLPFASSTPKLTEEEARRCIFEHACRQLHLENWGADAYEAIQNLPKSQVELVYAFDPATKDKLRLKLFYSSFPYRTAYLVNATTGAVHEDGSMRTPPYESQYVPYKFIPREWSFGMLGFLLVGLTVARRFLRSRR
ncbi:MAG: hypothetical protein ABL949_14100 [Fimbriimonadaceae bacterium]